MENNRERQRQRDQKRQDARLIFGAGHFQNCEQIEQGAGAEENPQQPKRHVAVVAAFHGDGEFRIGENEIDDGAEPLALHAFGDEMGDDLGDSQRTHRDPERLAADAAVKAVEKVGPIHRHARIQSRSNSLMLVLARVFASTRLTITAQARLGPAAPFACGLPGILPGTTTA